MYSEPVLIPSISVPNRWTRAYRATVRVPSASGAPVALIAVSLDRLDSIKQLTAQLMELDAMKS